MAAVGMEGKDKPVPGNSDGDAMLAPVPGSCRLGMAVVGFQSYVAVLTLCFGDPIGRNEGEARAGKPKERESDARVGCGCPNGGVEEPLVQGFCPNCVNDEANPANIDGVEDPNDNAGEAKPDVTLELDAVKGKETTGAGLGTVVFET
jgi:hypothetical protein